MRTAAGSARLTLVVVVSFALDRQSSALALTARQLLCCLGRRALQVLSEAQFSTRLHS